MKLDLDVKYNIQALNKAVILTVVFAVALCITPNAEAGVLSGITKIIAGVIEIPRSVIAGTSSGPLVLGTVFGALSGAIRSAVLVGMGAVEATLSVIPLALKVAPLIPIFI